jgi:hypothetical protein
MHQNLIFNYVILFILIDLLDFSIQQQIIQILSDRIKLLFLNFRFIDFECVMNNEINGIEMEMEKHMNLSCFTPRYLLYTILNY